MKTSLFNGQMSLKTAIVGLILVITVTVWAGYIIGERYFWGNVILEKDDRTLMETYQRVKSNPNDIVARLQLGAMYVKINEPEKALQEFQTAYKIDPKNFDAISNLGYGYLINSQFKKAISTLEPLVYEYPSHWAARYNLSYAYLMDKQYQKAVESFKITVQLRPEAADADYYLALALEGTGNKKEALACLDKALRMAPNYQEALEAKKRMSSN